jgi:hypothetical protein
MPVDVIHNEGSKLFNSFDILRYGKIMGSVSINYLPARDIRRTGQDE